MALATGQFTIIDYNDALTLTGFIGSNHPKTQMFNPDNDSYTPDWSKTDSGNGNLVLTPSLYKLGSQTDIITATEVQSVKWYEGTSTTAITSTGNFALSGTKSHVLTVKANVLAGLPGKDFRCEVIYRDPTTGLSLTHKMDISFSRVINGGGIVDALAIAPLGNVFKNNEIASLQAKIELWRGSVIDTTNVAYQWYKQDSSVSTDQGGGVGWLKLTETAGKYTGVTSQTMTIYPSGVVNVGVFKASIKDTDSSSNTYNKFYWDTLTFIDNTDPIQVNITSTGGDVFKNGVGSTTLTAKLFQAGGEIDSSGTGYNYTWIKYDQNANLVAGFSKTGKSITLTSSDVDTKATFYVEITAK